MKKAKYSNNNINSSDSLRAQPFLSADHQRNSTENPGEVDYHQSPDNSSGLQRAQHVKEELMQSMYR